MGDSLAELSAFNPYITPDGRQSFRFVAKNKAPSYWQGDLAKYHETLIGNELGKRQYCTKGYEILSRQPVEDNIIYEGVCK